MTGGGELLGGVTSRSGGREQKLVLDLSCESGLAIVGLDIDLSL